MSRDLKISGAIGHMNNMHKPGSQVSDNEIGIGNTYQWKLCAIDPNSTYSFFFEINRPPNAPSGTTGYIQFLTKYQDPSGPTILRVTTVAHSFSDVGHRALLPGFDQETAAAIIARLAVFKAEREDHDSLKYASCHLPPRV